MQALAFDRSSPALRHALPLALVAFVLALVIGASAAASPALLVLGALLAGVLLLLVRAPMWTIGPLTIVVILVSGILRLELDTAGAGSAAVLLSRGRVILLLAAFAVMRTISARRSLTIPVPVLIAMGAYAAMTLLSALIAQTNGAGSADMLSGVQRELILVVGSFLTGLAAWDVGDKRRNVIRGIAVMTAVVTLLSLYYWGWILGRVEAPGFLESIFAHARAFVAAMTNTPEDRSQFPLVETHANTSAVLYAGLLGLVAPMLLRSSRRADRVLLLMTVIAVAGGVISTQSRTGLIAFGLVGGAILLSSLRSAGVSRMTVILSLLGATAILFVAYQSLPDDRHFSDSSTLESRTRLWSAYFDDFAESPLLGHGYGYAATDRHGQSVHNEFLERLVDWGLIGFFAFLAPLVIFAGMGWQLRHRDDEDAALGVGVLIFMVVLVVSMQVLATWTGSPVATAISWMAFGLVTAAWARASARPDADAGTGERTADDRDEPAPAVEHGPVLVSPER